jgi:hypothetical protein
LITRKRCPLCNHDNRETLESELENLIITTDELDEQMNWPSGTSSKHQRNHMEGFVNFYKYNYFSNLTYKNLRNILIKVKEKRGSFHFPL